MFLGRQSPIKKSPKEQWWYEIITDRWLLILLQPREKWDSQNYIIREVRWVRGPDSDRTPVSPVRTEPDEPQKRLQSVRKLWKFGRNLDIWVPMAAAPAPVSQQGEDFDVSFSKPVDSCTTSPEAISEPADLSLRKSFACHKIKRILEWW